MLVPEVELCTGAFDDALLEGVAQVVISPGLSLREPFAVEAARRKALEGAEESIKRSTERTASLAKDRKRLDDESEFYKNRAQPDSLKRGYELNAQAASAEQRILAEARSEIARINERFDAEKKRFKDLLAQGARPVQRNPETDILIDPRFSGKPQ